MYGVKDNFERVRTDYAPELPRAMKAKRNAIAFLVGVGALSVALIWLLIALTPVLVWATILGAGAFAGLCFLFLAYGIDWISGVVEDIRGEFEIWSEAKKYGVRDE